MSTPPDMISKILQGGLMNYSQPNALDRGLMSGSPTMQLGMQMLANSNTPGTFGGILGRSLLGMQQQTQQNAGQQMGLANTAEDLRMKQMQRDMFTQAYPGWIKALSGQDPSQGGQPQGGSTGDPSQGTSGMPQAPQPQPQPGATGANGGAPNAGATPSAGYPAQPQGQTQDPFRMLQQGMLGAAMGMPGAKEMIDVAKTRLQYDPQLQTKIEAAKSDVAKDQELINQALRSGDTATAWGMTQKLQQDMGLVHVASMSGTQTRFTPQGIYTMDPNTGIQSLNGNVSLAPGAAQALGTRAAVESVGRAAGEAVPVTASDGTITQIPKSAIVGSPGTRGSAPIRTPSPSANVPTNAGSSSPAAARSADPVLSKALSDPEFKLPVLRVGSSVAPAVIEARTSLQKDSQDATSAASQALQYLTAAKQIMNSKGAPVVGFFGPVANEVSRVFGGGPNATNYQEVAKYLGNAALSNARQIYGNRMTQSEVRLQLNDLSPSVKMTAGAINNLLDNNIRSAQYTIDSAGRARRYLAASNDPQVFAEWNQQYYPREQIVNQPTVSGLRIGGSQTLNGFTVTRVK